MEREEASKEYKWDLTSLFKSQQDWDKEYDELDKISSKYEEFKDKLNDKNILKEYNSFDEMFSRRFMKLYLYAYFGHDTNLKDSVYENDLMKISTLSAKVSQLTSYIAPEMASLSDVYLNSLINDEEFKDYKISYETIIRERKHVLSKEQEKALATTSEYNDGFSKIYDTLIDTDLTFDSFKVDGKEYKMSNEKYGAYLSNTNREVRKKAYDSLYKEYRKFAHTFANIFAYQLKMCSSDLKIRHYDSYLKASLDSSLIPSKVYETLVNKVNESVDTMKEYFKLLKKELDLKDFAFYDSYVSISSMDKVFDYNTQKEIVYNAVEVLGKEYQDLIKTSYENNWIDVYPSDNKASGGYQFGSYDTHPYVFLNNTEDYSSMSTLAHELGHAMHTYYSNKYNNYPTSNYAIYVAEVASTVNELLLNKYMLKNSKDKKDKIFFLDQYIKQIKATVYRQTMFSEFEQKVHDLVENNVPLSLERINKEYKEVLTKHFDGVIEIDDNLIHEWIRISHFYRPFYVYKYATSYVCASYIVTKILKDEDDMKEKYFTLLKSGGNDYPDKLLKKAGIDLEKDEPYDILVSDLKNAINELRKLLNDK